ncbi:MAG: DUF1573 domain-containing protein [Bacteroidales bacterium]|nr:DUF1573 domain-containing protein [Bacteroidales bacterium]
MKKLLLTAVVALMVSAVFCTEASAQKKTKKQIKQEQAAKEAAVADSLAKLEASIQDGVEITFKYTEHNFGTMKSGSDISYSFEFVNTGKEPLIIANVATSCGCTTPEWSKEPIPSKGRGVIKVKYDSSRIGSFSKTISVYSNAKNSPTVLSIRGNVEYVNNN